MKQFIEQIGFPRLILLIAATVVTIGWLIMLSINASKPSLAILYTDLTPDQAQTVTQKLQSLNVSYKLTNDGTAVLTEKDRLAELRMQLAEENIGGQLGYEILDKQDALGTTAFMQNINHIRALEGELARSIQSLNVIVRARVKLSIPKRALFERDVVKPSAAITLKTRGYLRGEQVTAIRNLVSAAVPDLDPGRISMVDQNGTLLAAAGDSENNLGVAKLNDRAVQIEKMLRQQVETMLASVLGPGKVRAEVAVELNHQSIRKESEIFDPEMQVVGKTTTIEGGQENREGVESASTTVANNLPDANAQNEKGSTHKSTSRDSREEVQYQNSRTVTTSTVVAGSIKRLTISVVVDGVTKGKGKKAKWEPRSKEELAQIERLTKNAVGFDADRGDKVAIETMRFILPEPIKVPEEKKALLGLNPEDLKTIIMTMTIGLLAMIAWFFILRPMFRVRNVSSSTPALEGSEEKLAILQDLLQDKQLALPDADSVTNEMIEQAKSGDEEALLKLIEARDRNEIELSSENEIDVANIEGRIKDSLVNKIGTIIEKNPQQSLAVLRQWIAN